MAAPRTDEPLDSVGGAGRPEGVIVHCVPSLHLGGVNMSLLTVLPELARGPFRHVLCSVIDNLTLAPEFEALGIPVFSLGHRGSASGPRTLHRLWSELRARRATALHAHLSVAHIYGGLAGRLAGIPTIATYHSVDSGVETPNRRAYDRPKRLVTTTYIAVSEAVKQSMISTRHVPAHRIEVVHNGIDPTVFTPGSPDAAGAFRDELGLGPETRILLNVGRLVPEKNQLLLVPIMERLIAASTDVALVVVGDGELLPALREAVEGAGLAPKVHLLGRRFDVRELLGLVDAVVIASDTEGFSVFALEAMAARRPVVASDIPALREAIEPGRSGILVPPGDAGAFADALVGVLGSPERGAELGAAARCRVEEHFSADAMARHLERIYRRVSA